MFDPQKPHICGSGTTLIKNTILPVVGTGGGEWRKLCGDSLTAV